MTRFYFAPFKNLLQFFLYSFYMLMIFSLNLIKSISKKSYSINKIKLKVLPALIFTLLACTALAQRTEQGGSVNSGHFFGRVLDGKNGKPMAAASVQLFIANKDTAAGSAKTNIIATIITKPNGDFSIDNLSLIPNYTLQISAVGYKTYSKNISFATGNTKQQKAQKPAQQQDNEDKERPQVYGANSEKDLGNIKLEPDTATLAAVTVTATKPFFEMGVDRKVFNVDKNIVSQGQTGLEVLKQIPTVSVDIDGNVSIRNATPQIFIDDRPTTLTIDQIPADIIERVELITNPSAKYDASGGGGGIINIVLKKNKKKGYNGGIRAGIDSRAKINTGADLNYRQNKFNFFSSLNYNQRKTLFDFSTDRLNLTSPKRRIETDADAKNIGSFINLRGGFDFFVDNRNTVSAAGNYNQGNFNNQQFQHVDSSINDVYISYADISNKSEINFYNYGGQLSFKHNFAGADHDITADVNYNTSNNDNSLLINLESFLPDGTVNGSPFIQRVLNDGYNRLFTLQSDYENQRNPKLKIEAGLREAIRNFYNNNQQFGYDFTSNRYVFLPYLSAGYTFNDQVYAGYGTLTRKTKEWDYKFGLRIENSNYTGNLLGKDSSFSVSYPLSIFPSAFVTYHIDNSQDMQFNYSRRINRPSFFQLIPFYDFTDPQNPGIGNAELKPEFTNSFEFSYFFNYTKRANILLTVYARFTNDLITRYQYKDLNFSTPSPNDSIVYATFANANNSTSAGLEITNKAYLFNMWDLTINTNLFYATIDGANLKQGNTNSLLSGFVKLNNNFKLPKNFSVQFSADYFSKTILPTGTGSGGFGGGGRSFGGGFGGFNAATAQGYTLPRFDADIAVKKDWQFKAGKSASLSLSMSDIFKTNYYRLYTENQFFKQSLKRIRDPQIVRLNFTYRFGHSDASLFRRKNTKADQNTGTEMMNGVQ